MSSAAASNVKSDIADKEPPSFELPPNLRAGRNFGSLQDNKQPMAPGPVPKEKPLKEEFFLVTSGPEVDPETRRGVFGELERRGMKVEPWAPPLTVPLLKDGVTPALWANRYKELEKDERPPSPADFICQHYGRMSDGNTWQPFEWLTRKAIRKIDFPLYQALNNQLSLLKGNVASFPKGFEFLVQAQSSRVDKEIAEAGLMTPADAYRLFPDDPKKADRLYHAAKLRLTNS